jgi:hypothetical protein
MVPAQRQLCCRRFGNGPHASDEIGREARHLGASAGRHAQAADW